MDDAEFLRRCESPVWVWVYFRRIDVPSRERRLPIETRATYCLLTDAVQVWSTSGVYGAAVRIYLYVSGMYYVLRAVTVTNAF